MPVRASGAVRVQVVLSEGSAIHLQVLDALRPLLDGADPPVDLTISPLPAEAAAYHPSPEPVDLVVTIGSRAARAVLEAAGTAPVLSVLVPRAAYRVLGGGSGQRPRSAIFLDQPVERQIALVGALMPEARRVGVVAGPTLEREVLFRRFAERGLELELSVARDEGQVASAIAEVLPRSELILAVYDPLVLQPLSAKWLLYLAYQNRRPVIGFSLAFLKAGAVAAVYSTPEQIGRQAGGALLHWLSSRPRELPPARYPRDYRVELNPAVADSLAIELPPREWARTRMDQLLGGAP